jgi:uncharacterized protein (TIGR02246 family)
MREMFDRLLANWANAITAKDSARLASLVTEDFVFLAPGSGPLQGRRSLEDLYKDLFARFSLQQNFQFEEIQLIGDWAFGWGTDEIVMTPLDGSPAMRFVGHGLSLLQCGEDGAWRFARGINNAMRRDS